MQSDLTHLLYISWTKCLDKDNTNYCSFITKINENI